ncbi:MAG: alpha/beta hydrolase-fold protein [Gordonia sp. (in: high G+C Gram-positive bacteria)]|uniref:alpha/beta hydrolase n=1 Tax=Gordonia sp. (in: high G+C Gram-positive bacteria) TaxID=84139 RepID=UPI003BB54A4F
MHTNSHTSHFGNRAGRAIRQATVAVLALAVIAATASLQAGAARAVTIKQIDGQLSEVSLYSPALGRTVVNTVLRPRGGGPAPVLYLLNGRSGGSDGDSWLRMTAYRSFFAGKSVTVVSPQGGGFEYYSVGAWESYLRTELPRAIAGPLQTTGRAAIAGVSHTAPAALDLAGRSGNRYQAVASYSGCPAVSSPIGVASITAVMALGGANAFAVFGPPGSPGWTDHDPSLHPARLAGKAIYLGSGSGVPGTADGAHAGPALLAGPAQVEAIAAGCTRQMSSILAGHGVRHTLHQFPTGAHTWMLFENQLRDSWRVIGPAIGA